MSRQIKVDGEGTDWFESAVFILKDQVHKNQIPKNIVSYAEELLEKHMKVQGEVRSKSMASSNKWIDVCFWTSISILGLTCIAYFCL